MLVNFRIQRKESGSHVTPLHSSVNKCKLAKSARPQLSEQETGRSTNTGATAVRVYTSAVNAVRMQIPACSFLIDSGLTCQRCEEVEHERVSWCSGEAEGEAEGEHHSAEASKCRLTYSH